MRFNDVPISLLCIMVCFSSLATGEEVKKLNGHERELYSVAYSADGSCIASSANDQTIRVWSVSEGTNVVIKTGYGASRTASISPDGSLVAGRFETGLGVWNAKSGERVSKLIGDASADGTVLRVLFAPDGKSLAAGYERGVLRIWDVTAQKSVAELRRAEPGADSHAILSMAFLPDAQLAVGYDNALVIWSVTKQSETKRLSDISTPSLYCVKDSKVLIANQQGNVGELNIWSTLNWDNLFTSDQKNHSENFLRSLAPINGKLALGVNDNGEFESFDLTSFRRTKKTFPTPYRTTPGGYAISPSGKQVAHHAGGNQYQILLQSIDFR